MEDRSGKRRRCARRLPPNPDKICRLNINSRIKDSTKRVRRRRRPCPRHNCVGSHRWLLLRSSNDFNESRVHLDVLKFTSYSTRFHALDQMQLYNPLKREFKITFEISHSFRRKDMRKKIRPFSIDQIYVEFHLK